MTIKAVQFAIAQNTATLVVPLSSFPNLQPSLQDPLPVEIKNEDTTAVVWWGGPDVTSIKGQSITAGNVAIMNLYGNDLPWVYTTASSNPIVSIVVGRQ